MSEKTPLIQVDHLKKYYPIKGGIITHVTGNIHAVDDVSFSITEGETLGLVGESGCGKSTIGRQLVGLETPTEGKIYYQGSDISALKSREMHQIRTQLQMVFQDPYSSLNPRKHIYEILSQPMLYHHISTKATIEKDLERLLDMVGLPKHVLARYPHEFSGGQRQRIGIAKALSLNPKFIVCDEPVSALDVSIQAQILKLIKDLQKEYNYTIVFITHDLGVVANIADRVAVLYAGQIIEFANVEELFYDPRHPYTWALLSSLPQLAERNTKLFSITGTPPSLYNKIIGDPFAPRNQYCLKIDTLEEPPMFKVTDTHYAKTWLLDPRAPKTEKPEAIQNIHEKLLKAYNL